MAKWLIIDGYNLLFRCFYAIPHLSRSDGFPTNAIHGWLRSLWKLADTEKPEQMLVVFDLGDDPLKLELLPEYKADRVEMPDTLKPQVSVVKDLTRLMGIDTVEIAEVEADDIIGTYAATLAKAENEVYIVSADKDLAQCVQDRVWILVPPPTANAKVGWRRLDAAGVVEKFGVRPDQIPDYLALVGDHVDGIPGITGVGPKTAAKWLQEFGSVNGVLENLDQIKPERFRPLLDQGRAALARNLQLTTLNCGIALPAAERNIANPSGLFSLLEKLEMKNHLEEARRRYREPDLFPGF